MKNVIPLLLLGSLPWLAVPARAERGVVHADGILIVKGADVASARITVVPQNAPAYALRNGTKRFTLRLPVDDTYLVSFVREGCPTKEVYFDTRVPVEFAARDFDFPFQVTLEHLAPERMFAYEGPVGFVRYQHPITDFGYETQYVVKVDEEMHERLREMEATGSDPKVIGAPVAVMVVDVSRDGQERVVKAANPAEAGAEDGTVAPTVREVPRLVHTLAASSVASPEPMAAVEDIPLVETAPEPPAEPVTRPSVPEPPVVEAVGTVPAAPVPTALPKAEVVRTSSTAVSVRAERDETVHQAPPAPMVLNGLELAREEETLVEQRMVIRIVRLVGPDGTVVDELRKVTHAFGGVYFFHNAQSITERAFLERAAQR